MWQMIQNVCTGIVGVEVFIMVWVFVSMYLDERRERKHKQTKAPTHTRICCATPDGGMCIHDDEWDGACCTCPVELTCEEMRRREKEIMDEKED